MVRARVASRAPPGMSELETDEEPEAPVGPGPAGDKAGGGLLDPKPTGALPSLVFQNQEAAAQGQHSVSCQGCRAKQTALPSQGSQPPSHGHLAGAGGDLRPREGREVRHLAVSSHGTWL